MAVGSDGPVTDDAVGGGAVVAGNVEDTVTAVDGGGVVDAGGGIDVVVASVDTRVDDDDDGVVVSTTGTVDAMSSSPPQADTHMPVVGVWGRRFSEDPVLRLFECRDCEGRPARSGAPARGQQVRPAWIDGSACARR